MVDRMLERAKAVTRHERWTAVEYVRFAEHLVIPVERIRASQGLGRRVEKRLREKWA
jgi:RNA-directed DNA polymerase